MVTAKTFPEGENLWLREGTGGGEGVRAGWGRHVRYSRRGMSRDICHVVTQSGASDVSVISFC